MGWTHDVKNNGNSTTYTHKQVYVFFMNKGHKRMSFLREAMGGEKITFGGNYETRWAASEKKQSKS